MRSLQTIAAAAALLTAPFGALQAQPLPPPRPADIGGSTPAPSAPTPEGPARPPLPAAGLLDPSGCLAQLRAAGALAVSVAQPRSGNAACLIENPVRLSRLSEAGRSIALTDGPIVACRFALSFAAWAGGSAAPLLSAQRGAALAAIQTGPGWECRGRNRQPGAKMSAHANGLAIDVAGFTFADGSRLAVSGAKDPGVQAVRASACQWFTTVLGPGSDVFHSDHLHLDLQSPWSARELPNVPVTHNSIVRRPTKRQRRLVGGRWSP